LDNWRNKKHHNSLSHSVTHSFTPLTHSLTHTTHSHHSLTPLTHTTHSHHSLTPLNHSLNHSLTHSLTFSFDHSHSREIWYAAASAPLPPPLRQSAHSSEHFSFYSLDSSLLYYSTTLLLHSSTVLELTLPFSTRVLCWVHYFTLFGWMSNTLLYKHNSLHFFTHSLTLTHSLDYCLSSVTIVTVTGLSLTRSLTPSLRLGHSWYRSKIMKMPHSLTHSLTHFRSTAVFDDSCHPSPLPLPLFTAPTTPKTGHHI
jgi:hypothetical protein